MKPSDAHISGLRSALAVSPENVPLRLMLADAMKDAHRPQEAVEEYREVLKRERQHVEALFGLGSALFTTGKFQEASVPLFSLVSIQPTHAEARLLLARALFETGDAIEAQQQYEAAIARKPELADAALELVLFGAERSDARRVKVGREGAEDSTIEGAEEKPDVKFADVGGMESVKESIRISVIYPLRDPELYKAYGKKTGGGILLFGPPGCGKTHLARATAGEVGFSFIHVGIEEVLDMWLGNSEKNLHAVFSKARRLAPSIIFFDEIEAIGGRRSSMSSHAGKPIVNQFLGEMDGFGKSNTDVLVMGATNAPWDLDPAFRRPGRFDRIIFIPPPDLPSRSEILSLHLRGKPTESIDVVKVAKKTEGYSGADLAGLVDRAAETALREAMKTRKVRPLTTDDLMKALAMTRPTTAEWLSTARNYVRYSNEGGTYDEVAEYLKETGI